ncbi:MAG: tRNA glutamyl-Q(34) synthetase GluQRS [Gammaproteobacteria bacterium]|nr:MAG: tRNA glutamyl-Q(34) synthetase GluQRS [Gammaproteobacteria bacterium]
MNRGGQPTPAYCGRFAPSPTGPLHFGSLVAALGSFLDARARNGLWLVRIDDLDRPRNVTGATASILHDLERLGLHWDQEVRYQLPRRGVYQDTLESMRTRGLAYPCACSRKQVGTRPYPGTCRNGVAAGKNPRSLRLHTGSAPVEIRDRVQGTFGQVLSETVGDFVVLRGDGIPAYHLATALDDAALGITHVVRGSDLLDSTPRQVFLQQQLRLPTPTYAHLPVATNNKGQKLSKQTHAQPVSAQDPTRLLWAALDFLGQQPSTEWLDASPQELLGEATSRWDLARIPATSGAAPEI